MMDLFLTNTQLFVPQDVNWWAGLEWCELMWCFYHPFRLWFWRHPFTSDVWYSDIIKCFLILLVTSPESFHHRPSFLFSVFGVLVIFSAYMKTGVLAEKCFTNTKVSICEAFHVLFYYVKLTKQPFFMKCFGCTLVQSKLIWYLVI